MTRIRGKSFFQVRGEPMERKFTRPSNRTGYCGALLRLLEGEVTGEDLFREGIKLTNEDSPADQSNGSGVLVAYADEIIARNKEGGTDITGNNINELCNASKSYHYAANTLRRLQQFEASADFYLISGRIGLATIESGGIREFRNDAVLKDLLDMADRSYMRARAVYRETGADKNIEAAIIEGKNLRSCRARLERRWLNYSILSAWRILSKYGNSLCQILFCYSIAIIVLSIVYFYLLSPTSNISLLGVIWHSLVVSMSGNPVFEPSKAYFDGALRIIGFFWTALLGQLIVQRVSVKM